MLVQLKCYMCWLSCPPGEVEICSYSTQFSVLIAVADDTLLDMVLTMTEKVGLVHQMPYACTRKGFPSHMEKVTSLIMLIICIFNKSCK